MLPTETWLLNYLLNSLWQVPLLFAAAWLAARAARRAGPAFQHAIWTSTLFAEVLLPACTARPDQAFLALLHWLVPLHHDPTASTAHVDVIMGPARAAEGLQLGPTLLHTAVLLYLCVVAFFAARLAIGMYRTNRLYLRAEPYLLTGHAAQSYHRFARLFAVPNALLADSTEIAGPITLGIRRPILLLPPALDSHLLAEDFDAALAHEFAHMRRRDFAKNLAYELLSLPIAFHPFLQLTRRHVAESRELICDAMAAEAVAGKQRYARSLLRLAAKFSEDIQPSTPHAIGFFDPNPFRNFERRVMNLTTKPIELRAPARLALTALSLFLIAGACTSALAFRLQVAAPASQTTSPAIQTTPQTTPGATAKATIHYPVFTLAIPRATKGTPANAFVAETQPSTTPDGSTPPVVLKMLTPAYIGDEQTSTQKGVTVSSSVLAGNRITFVAPIYPPEAKAAGIQGSVVFDATISKDGQLSSLKLVSGPPELTKAAWAAVKQWTWKPYLLNGQSVAVQTTLTVNFALTPDATPSPSPQPQAETTRPVVINSVPPEYPTGAAKEKMGGDVEISLIVGTDGVPKNVVVVKGLRSDFDQRALEAVRQYRFKPALRDGNPVDQPLFVDVDFKIL